MTISQPESGKSAPLDEVLSVFVNDHRRAILRSLNNTDQTTMEVSALVDQVTEHVRDGEPLDHDHRRRVRIALHHVHLPKLEACGMIVRDTETNQVRNVTGELSKELLTLVDSSEVNE